ncbi:MULTISPECIES: peroxiredoxin family protein [Salinibaculum]|uniref:peroxiredoxin family protein n=1 Tax=Salinibaculum TaxID=2732368 RepID=UPI0030D001A8
MIEDGDEAPEFTLPAVADGEFGEVSLADYLGDDIVVLAFYPADFNPCCDGETTDLDQLDLFTMQKDVSIVGISGDSVYSHREFAEAYDLRIPLLSDVDGAVAADYGVAVDPDSGYQCNRAVVVVDPEGTVQYAWQTEKLRELPPTDAVRRAVDDIGGAGIAEARYRVGHAHYVEGRRAFTSAMDEFGDREWMMAQNDFSRAREEFDEAADQFDTAVRFGEGDDTVPYFERAKEKSRALSRAAEWLAGSASAYASGEGADAMDLRDDAERPLETARDIREPPDPDDFPPGDDPAETDDDEATTLLPDEEEPTASLDADIDDGPDATEDGVERGPADATEPKGTPDQAAAASDGAADDVESEGDTIDDAELAEIAAEVEAQTEQGQPAAKATSGGAGPDSPSQSGTAEEDGEETDDEELSVDGTLDLADPTEGAESTDEDEDESAADETTDESTGVEEDGSHGVPDSL